MPFRYAHHVMLLMLGPAIAVAFWPRYFGDLGSATFAFHAHGLTATAWVVLVAAQSWTIHTKRHALHRLVGRAAFVLVPLFASGAALAMQSMAVKYVTRSDPFYAALGPLLGLDDLISTTALVVFVRAALVHRRHPRIHGGYLLSSVMLVIPPIVARLNLPVSPTWHVGELLAATPAALLAVNHPRYARPFLVLLGVLAFKVAADTFLGFNPVWLSIFVALPRFWSVSVAIAALALAFAALWTGWHPTSWRGSGVPPLTLKDVTER